MAANPLSAPPEVLRTEAFPAVNVPATTLIRISSFTTNEPFFGNSGNNRFDAPHPDPRYRTSYVGTSLAVAVAETLLHDEAPVHGRYVLPLDALRNLHVLRFEGEVLLLLPLIGAQLKRLGGNADLAGSYDYSKTHAWSAAVYDNPAKYDGILYMSRHLNTEQAVVLFDRAASKISLSKHCTLIEDPGFPAVARDLGIIV